MKRVWLPTLLAVIVWSGSADALLAAILGGQGSGAEYHLLFAILAVFAVLTLMTTFVVRA